MARLAEAQADGAVGGRRDDALGEQAPAFERIGVQRAEQRIHAPIIEAGGAAGRRQPWSPSWLNIRQAPGWARALPKSLRLAGDGPSWRRRARGQCRFSFEGPAAT